MSSVIFSNPGEIDPFVIQTMGVSAKLGSNPIGFFGTGLKFALAVLLRSKQVVTIYSGFNRFTFRIDQKVFRGQTFGQIFMDTDRKVSPDDFMYEPVETSILGFTTELGKNWELWMAHRELYCNALDEGGRVEIGDHVQAQPGHTFIVVEGDAFLHAHQNRDYLLLSQPLYADNEIAFHPGPSDKLYYKGIFVGTLAKPSVHTINIKRAITLTEDRTFKYVYEVGWALRSGIENCTNSTVLARILSAPDGTFESEFSWEHATIQPDSVLEKTMGALYNSKNALLTRGARKRWRQHIKATDYEPATLSVVQTKMLAKALDFLKRLGYDIGEVNIVSNLEGMLSGCVEHGKIYISNACFDRGTKYLAATILEEHLHLTTGASDFTTNFQNLLFDKIISLGEDLIGEPL